MNCVSEFTLILGLCVYNRYQILRKVDKGRVLNIV
jgi:hypothetical protein